MYLHIEHRKRDFKKSWKLESGPKLYSVGHSRHADLRLDEDHAGILGVLECKQSLWSFTHLVAPNEKVKDRFIPIKGRTVIPIKNGELHLVPFERKIQLFENGDKSSSGSSEAPWVWLVWRRNNKIWYSESCSSTDKIQWPHNQEPVSIQPTSQWKTIENDGISLSFKTASTPDTKDLLNSASKELFDPTLRPYLIGVVLACAAVGLLTFFGKKESDAPLASKPNLSESTLINLEKKPTPPASKNAVTKAMDKLSVPKTANSAKPKAHRALGQVFSQIGKMSMKSLNVNTGAKTIAITPTTTLTQAASTAKTFKVLGNMGTGTGLNPSQFTKGLKKDSEAGLGSPIGGSDIGQISQGNIGQGDLGLLHKESEVSGGLDREIIAKYIQTQKGKILYCYERQLSANPGLFGKVSIKFQISGDGSVSSQNIGESTINNAGIESCLLQLVAKWKFPKPEGGVNVNVTYPFVFKSLN